MLYLYQVLLHCPGWLQTLNPSSSASRILGFLGFHVLPCLELCHFLKLTIHQYLTRADKSGNL